MSRIERRGLHGDCLACGDELSHGPVMLFTVGKDKELVPGVKVHEDPQASLSTSKLAPPLQGEDALDEILPQLGSWSRPSSSRG